MAKTNETLEQEITRLIRKLHDEDSVAVVEVIEGILNIMPQPCLVTLNHATAAELSKQLHGGPLLFGGGQGGEDYCGKGKD